MSVYCVLAMLCLLLVGLLPLALGALPAMVDLSHHYDNDTQYWPGTSRFHFTKMITSSTKDWYAVNDFQTAEHSGTHLDAPYHFNSSGWQLGQIPLERFFGNAVVVNLRAQAAQDPEYLVTEEDLTAWESEHGPMPHNATVLLDFGWASKYHNTTQFFGTLTTNDSTTYHFPGLSERGARWLGESGKVYGVGTDTSSIDYGQTKNYEAHRVLAAHNIYNLEHVALPESPLPASGFRILALPIKIRHGTGGPVRIVAIP